MGMKDKLIQSQPRLYGKSTLVTNAFLADCKAGKSVIYSHPDFVALSRKSYEALVKEAESSKCPRCGSDSIMHVQNH